MRHTTEKATEGSHPFKECRHPIAYALECFEVHQASFYILDTFHLSHFCHTNVTSFSKYVITEDGWTRHTLYYQCDRITEIMLQVAAVLVGQFKPVCTHAKCTCCTWLLSCSDTVSSTASCDFLLSFFFFFLTTSSAVTHNCGKRSGWREE